MLGRHDSRDRGTGRGLALGIVFGLLAWVAVVWAVVSLL
jgi:hypothetical protein